MMPSARLALEELSSAVNLVAQELVKQRAEIKHVIKELYDVQL